MTANCLVLLVGLDLLDDWRLVYGEMIVIWDENRFVSEFCGLTAVAGQNVACATALAEGLFFNPTL